MEDSPPVPNSEEGKDDKDKKDVPSGDHDAEFWEEEDLPEEHAAKPVAGGQAPPPLRPAVTFEQPRVTLPPDSADEDEAPEPRRRQPRDSARPAPVDSSRIGLLGGRNVGKTYFFNGIIYRTLTHKTSGAVSRYLQSSSLDVRQKPEDPGQPEDLFDVITAYEKWTKYVGTTIALEKWYSLHLTFQAGVIGTNRGSMTLEFLDGSGEGFTRPLDHETEPTWRAAFSTAGIMIFCLPMWAAFPSQLGEEDKEYRKEFLKDFFTVIKSYTQIRVPDANVRAILALTHADDDERCALREVTEQWIRPVLNDPKEYLTRLRSRTGITRYLASAQAVSEYLYEKLNQSGDKLVERIPEELEKLGRGRPWIIPVSAVEGKTLERAVAIRKQNPNDPVLDELLKSPPVPVHVELPLLAALCESHNALM